MTEKFLATKREIEEHRKLNVELMSYDKLTTPELIKRLVEESFNETNAHYKCAYLKLVLTRRGVTDEEIVAQVIELDGGQVEADPESFGVTDEEIASFGVEEDR